jgi:hypothetical protein
MRQNPILLFKSGLRQQLDAGGQGRDDLLPQRTLHAAGVVEGGATRRGAVDDRALTPSGPAGGRLHLTGHTSLRVARRPLVRRAATHLRWTSEMHPEAARRAFEPLPICSIRAHRRSWQLLPTNGTRSTLSYCGQNCSRAGFHAVCTVRRGGLGRGVRGQSSLSPPPTKLIAA